MSNIDLNSMLNSANRLTVLSIEDLLFINVNDAMVVEVLNFHRNIPNGGGIFFWSPTELKANHNGGTIIDPDKPFPSNWNDNGEVSYWFESSAKSELQGCWVRQFCNQLSPTIFGAIGDSNYFNQIDKQWYRDSLYTHLATPSSLQINSLIRYLDAIDGGIITLDKRYLICDSLKLTNKVSIKGLYRGQANNIASCALCADWGLNSIRQPDNTFSNPILNIDFSESCIGGITLDNFSIIGTSGNADENELQADRCAISAFCFLNSTFSNLTIENFKKPALNLVGLVQDMHIPGLWIEGCGTNTSTEYYAAIETKVSKNDILSKEFLAEKTAPNALHFSGLRMNANKAFLDINNGETNLGEIDFKGCKFEIRDWQKFHQSPFSISKGTGSVFFCSGTHFTIPTCSNLIGDSVWCFNIQNYQTQFSNVTLRGSKTESIRMIKSSGKWFTITDTTFKDAPTSTYGLNINAGIVDVTLQQRMSNAFGTRMGIKIGNNVHVKRLDLMSYIQTTEDVISGAIIQKRHSPKETRKQPVIDSVNIMDDDSGFNLYHELYSNLSK